MASINPITGEATGYTGPTIPTSIEEGDILAGNDELGWTTMSRINPLIQISPGPNTKYGYDAGATNQAVFALAVGTFAGKTNQGTRATGIGYLAGYTGQGADGTALGSAAGQNNQGANSVAVGKQSGYDSQGISSVAVGNECGKSNQGTFAVAVGNEAGKIDQSDYAIAIGDESGKTSQGIGAIAVGSEAGHTSQSNDGIAIGNQAGMDTQGVESIAIGQRAGKVTQGTHAVAIGIDCGKTSQGAKAVAIGHKAGITNQPANSIIINASSTTLNGTHAGLYMDPIRDGDEEIDIPYSVQSMHYNPTTKEIFYGGSPSFRKTLIVSSSVNHSAIASLNTGCIVKVHAMVEGNDNWYAYATFVRFTGSTRIYTSGSSSSNLTWSVVSPTGGIQLNVNHVGGAAYTVRYCLEFVTN
jgi:hypothetical protein